MTAAQRLHLPRHAGGTGSPGAPTGRGGAAARRPRRAGGALGLGGRARLRAVRCPRGPARGPGRRDPARRWRAALVAGGLGWPVRGVRGGRPGREWAAGLRGAEPGQAAGRVLLRRADLGSPQTGRRLRRSPPLWLRRRPRLVCGGRGEAWPPPLPRGWLCLGLRLWGSAGLPGGRPGWRGLVFVHPPEKKAPWTQCLPNVGY